MSPNKCDNYFVKGDKNNTMIIKINLLQNIILKQSNPQNYTICNFHIKENKSILQNYFTKEILNR